MSTVSYALGTPRAAVSRGGDCRAHDLSRKLDVHGPHTFVAAEHCRIDNGLLGVTVGPEGGAPLVTVAGWRGRVVVDDLLEDVLTDEVGGTTSTAEWLSLGTVAVDSPSTAALEGVVLEVVNPEVVILRLRVPALGDAYLTLERGERMLRIQHGRASGAPVEVVRRVRWTDDPSPAGVAMLGRVEEAVPARDGFPRFLASTGRVTVDASAFSLSTTAVESETFSAGVGTYALGDTPGVQHAQMGDASDPLMVVTRAPV